MPGSHCRIPRRRPSPVYCTPSLHREGIWRPCIFFHCMESTIWQADPQISWSIGRIPGCKWLMLFPSQPYPGILRWTRLSAVLFRFRLLDPGNLRWVHWSFFSIRRTRSNGDPLQFYGNRHLWGSTVWYSSLYILSLQLRVSCRLPDVRSGIPLPVPVLFLLPQGLIPLFCVPSYRRKIR